MRWATAQLGLVLEEAKPPPRERRRHEGGGGAAARPATPSTLAVSALPRAVLARATNRRERGLDGIPGLILGQTMLE